MCDQVAAVHLAEGRRSLSHEVAVRGLGIQGATVLGQLLPGLVSVSNRYQPPPQVVS